MQDKNNNANNLLIRNTGEDQLGFDNYTKEVLKGRVSSRNSGKGGQNDVGWKCGGATVCGAVHARLDSYGGSRA